jgi:hypothetical protein
VRLRWTRPGVTSDALSGSMYPRNPSDMLDQHDFRDRRQQSGLLSAGKRVEARSLPRRSHRPIRFLRGRIGSNQRREIESPVAPQATRPPRGPRTEQRVTSLERSFGDASGDAPKVRGRHSTQGRNIHREAARRNPHPLRNSSESIARAQRRLRKQTRSSTCLRGEVPLRVPTFSSGRRQLPATNIQRLRCAFKPLRDSCVSPDSLASLLPCASRCVAGRTSLRTPHFRPPSARPHAPRKGVGRAPLRLHPHPGVGGRTLRPRGLGSPGLRRRRSRGIGVADRRRKLRRHKAAGIAWANVYSPHVLYVPALPERNPSPTLRSGPEPGSGPAIFREAP